MKTKTTSAEAPSYSPQSDALTGKWNPPHVKKGTSLGIASVPNLRDAGGYTTADGSVVRRGLAYRSNQLNAISADDMTKIAALGLKNDFDLRTAEERDAKPDELPAGVKNVWLNVLADAKGSAAEVEKLLSDPKAANAMLGDGKVSAEFVSAYREFITLPSANAAFRQLFLELSDKEQLPSLYHCTTGKDRTGWASAALLTLLGVPLDKVYEDYLRSNDYVLPAYKSFIDGFVAAGGDPSITQDALEARKQSTCKRRSIKSRLSTEASKTILTRDLASIERVSRNFETDFFEQTSKAL